MAVPLRRGRRPRAVRLRWFVGTVAASAVAIATPAGSQDGLIARRAKGQDGFFNGFSDRDSLPNFRFQYAGKVTWSAARADSPAEVWRGLPEMAGTLGSKGQSAMKRCQKLSAAPLLGATVDVSWLFSLRPTAYPSHRPILSGSEPCYFWRRTFLRMSGQNSWKM
jgi:hypothetical protein